MQVNGNAGDVRDASQAEEGVRLIDWAAREMPVVRSLREQFGREQPLKGLQLAACLHVTSETANLALARTAASVSASGASPHTCTTIRAGSTRVAWASSRTSTPFRGWR